MSHKTALTPDQVRQRFRQRGETLTSWAKARGWKPQSVFRVMAGQDKAHFGRAHEIAVALGLKVPDAASVNDPQNASAQPSTGSASRNTQRRAHA